MNNVSHSKSVTEEMVTVGLAVSLASKAERSSAVTKPCSEFEQADKPNATVVTPSTMKTQRAFMALALSVCRRREPERGQLMRLAYKLRLASFAHWNKVNRYMTFSLTDPFLSLT